jgi:hypothetical protein
MTMNEPCYGPMDEALVRLGDRGPDLRNGMTSHAPMAVEALCALGRGDAVPAWVERYRDGMLPWPAPSRRIGAEDWPAALGREDRVADWRAFFANELEEAPWREVLDRWSLRLAPGISAAATHGVIRVGHAARSLAEEGTPLRRQELADGLASWAASYAELPTSRGAAALGLDPRQAIERVVVVPPERRRFHGTITSSLEVLSEFAEFPPVIDYLDVSREARSLVGELTEVFARVYLANARDVLTSLVFVHGVTSIAAVGNLLPHVGEETGRTALRFAWQCSCALYATFGSRPAPAGEIEPPRRDAATLVDMAVDHGEEHAIKFTEACLAQHRRFPSAAYLAAASDAIQRLPRA